MCVNLICFADDLALKLADSLYDIGNYQEAVTEYKRYLFFHPESNNQSDIYHKIALCFRKGSDWDSAIFYLKLSANSASSDITRNQRKIDLAVTYTAKGDYSTSNFLLVKITAFSKNKEVKQKAQLILTLNYIYTFQWKRAEEAFTNYVKLNPNISGGEHNRIIKLLRKAIQEPLKSPNVAKWLSTFIPGLGQIYCGDWRNGINALLLNTTLIYWCLDLAGKRQFHDSINVGLFSKRYYFGNRSHAIRIAKEKRRQKNLNYQDTILKLLGTNLAHAAK